MKTLERLRFDANFMRHLVAWETLPARPAQYAPFPSGLHHSLLTAFQSFGITQLYSHQALAISAALRGENVVVVTGTASGKTLCYNAPVLHTLLTNPNARALYLFPTKALAQDQAAVLANLMAAMDGGRTTDDDQPTSHLSLPTSHLRLPSTVHVYDGDTPQSQRATIRKASGILLSNPDMLHTGILPHHPRWAEWFANLKFVVLDELHTYRGVFGSHMANVLRRLKRICAFYGSAPQFICTSATITNYHSLTQKLIEAPVTAVTEDGSPRAEKSILVYNPPLIDPALGLRRSYLLEAQRVASEFLSDGVQTVLFARTRNATEILLGYVRDAEQQRERDPQSIRGYRGGYLPLERREIERGLRAGAVRGVVATNALELGVDIGQLGAAVLAGYPGTIASLWQQAGRAGRRDETSAAVLIASAAPLDQFLAAHPRYLFERTPEHALINPDNLSLLAGHLRCAAFELPFKAGEAFGAVSNVDELLQALAEEGDLHESRGTYRWVGSEYPADSISLRSATDDRIVIQDATQGRPIVIGEVDRDTAALRVHEGAVYLHEGRAFVVTRLDWENGLADVSAQDVDYFTEASEAVDVAVVEVFDADPHPSLPHPETPDGGGPGRGWGSLLITSQPASYRKIKRYTHENLGYGEITLPAREFQTTGYWLWIPKELENELARAGVLVGPNDYGPNWQQQRNAARARDGFRCRQCGALESGREHDVHHLLPFRSFGYVPGLNDNYVQANALDNLLTLCRACHARTEAGRGTQTALGGLAYALGNLAPLFLMCDPRDLGVLSENRSKETGAPTITLYDRAPEGMGLAEQLYLSHAELLRGALDLVRACQCQSGCPACVGPVSIDAVDVKDLTRRLAEQLVNG